MPHEPQIIELQAGGPDDPNASRTAAVLAAYFHAEHTRTFRRLLWRRLALVATGWSLVSIIMLSKMALCVGLGVLGGAAAWAAVMEWRASKRLNRLASKN